MRSTASSGSASPAHKRRPVSLSRSLSASFGLVDRTTVTVWAFMAEIDASVTIRVVVGFGQIVSA